MKDTPKVTTYIIYLDPSTDLTIFKADGDYSHLDDVDNISEEAYEEFKYLMFNGMGNFCLPEVTIPEFVSAIRKDLDAKVIRAFLSW